MDKITLRPSQLSDLLAKTIPAGMPVLITGAPGIGKSDVVAQATQEAGADIIISHPVVNDPTDAKGFPWPNKNGKSATFLPFGDLHRALDSKTKTVWFLDDLGQAPPSVQASYMQLILARRVNGHILPDCVTFIAATNRRTDRAGVTGILEPVKSRFATIVELAASLSDFCEWAIGADMPPELIAFLRFRPELLHRFEATADMTNSPSPRTWASVGRLLGLRLDSHLEFAAIAGAVGEGEAAEFKAFLKVFRDLPSIDGILLGPDTAPIPQEPSALYAVSAALAHRANINNFGRIVTYCERMMAAGKGEFSVLTIRDAHRREPKIAKTSEFITRVASTEIGRLITGEATS